MSQPLATANVLVESAYAAATKSVILSKAPFTLNEYVLLKDKYHLHIIYSTVGTTFHYLTAVITEMQFEY